MKITHYLYKKKVWEEAGLEKVDWSRVNDYGLSKGSTSFSVVPGTYKSKVCHKGTDCINSKLFSEKNWIPFHLPYKK